MFDIEPKYIEYLFLEPTLLSCMLVSLFFVLLSHFRPLWAIAIICVQPYLLWMVSFNIGFAFYPAYALAAALLIQYRKSIFNAAVNKQYQGIILLSMILVIWAILSPMFYPVRDGYHVGWTMSRQRSIEILLPLLLLPIVIRTPYQINKFLHALIYSLIISHIILFFLSLSFVASGESLGSLWKMRILGLTPVYWESGLLLICLIYLFVSKKISLAPGVLLSIIAVLGLAIGGSRARIVATLLSGAYFVIPYIGRKAVGLIAFVVVAVSVFIILPDSFKSSIFSRIVERIEQSSNTDIQEATSGRSDLYLEAFERWKESPILGVGSGYAVRPILIYDEPVRRSPHSFFVELLACQGIIGVILLFVIFFKLSKKIFIFNKSIAVLSYFKAEERLIIAFILYGITNWAFKAHWGIAFTSIALFVCLDRIILFEFKRYNIINQPFNGGTGSNRR